jgi:Flp pilus assembly protein TadG
MSWLTGRFHRDDRGNIAASVAVVPAVIMLFFVVVQIGMWFHARTVVTSAAQHALEAARVEGGSDGAGQEAATEFVAQVGGLDRDSVVVDIDHDAGQVTVSVQADSLAFMPALDLPVTASISGPEERLVP